MYRHLLLTVRSCFSHTHLIDKGGTEGEESHVEKVRLT